MYNEFSLQSIDTSTKERLIKVTVNKDIDFNGTKDLVVEVFERHTKTPLIVDYSIEENALLIKLRDWPIPNTQYILGVKGLKSVIGEELSGNIKARVEFPSNITSKAEIISPSNFEKVEELNIKLKELLAKEGDKYINSFYVEVSTDNAFINVPYKLSIKEKDNVSIALRSKGQYYIRARVEDYNDKDNIQYGDWSEVITFIYGNESESGEMPPITGPDEEIEDDDPIVQIDEFEIISMPEQGETPESFLFEFSIELENLLNDDNIIIIRKDVK